MTMRAWIALSIVALTGCSTETQLLELRRDRLLQLETNATQIRDAIPQGSFDPARYDVYLALDTDIFQRVFSEIDGTRFEVVAKGRPVTIEIDKFATTFHPGSPEISLAAKAIDQRSGLEAGLDLDARLVLVGDPAKPDELVARVYATRVVPNMRWGPLDITRMRFVRSLLTLEATKLTDKLPAMRLPLAREFSFGSPAQTRDSGQIATGNGSWIRGQVSLPSTEASGRFVVNNILFIENGVHLFASVEGL
jgi:hypothetical protein